MNRRSFAKAAAFTASVAYLWIPKLAIAKISGDPREAIIRARTVLASNWNMLPRGSSTAVANNGQYTAAIQTATATLRLNQYVDVTSPGTEFSANSSGLAMFGAFHVDGIDHCNLFFARNEERSLAYVATVPFLMQSFMLENALKDLSAQKTIGLLYPTDKIQVFEAYLGHAPAIPIRVSCENSFWVCSYDVAGPRAGAGKFGIWAKNGNSRQPILERTFEWAFT
jgi:hypothetical protein